MSVEASELLTDEDLDAREDGLSFATFTSDSEKRARKRRTANKPPLYSRSPYLSSMNLRGKKPGPGERSTQGRSPSTPTSKETWLALLRNRHAQPMGAEHDVTQNRTSTVPSSPEHLKEALDMKRPKHSCVFSNGYAPIFKEKEEMYEEIIGLKKILQAQKTENGLMKTKLQIMEKEKNKKEKQIEQLLDTTKGPDFSRSLLDSTESNVALKRLKQKVLKLEQQCREKESALGLLKSDLKTTNMEEMKVTMEIYYEEIQRLRSLNQSSDQRESKDTERPQKVLSSTVLRLSKNLNQLQAENQTLRHELATEIATMTETPSGRAKGYKDWSKQRLVRRLVELEKKFVAKMREMDKSSATDHVITTRVPVTTETEQNAQAVSVSTSLHVGPVTLHESELQKECFRLRALVKRLTEDLVELRKTGEESLKIKRLEENIEEKGRVEIIKESNQTEKLNQVHGDLQVPSQAEDEESAPSEPSNDVTSTPEPDSSLGDMVTLLQSAFRGHLARASQLIYSIGGVTESKDVTQRNMTASPTTGPRRASTHGDDGEVSEVADDSCSSVFSPAPGQFPHPANLDSGQLTDLDDIIMTPSQPVRSVDSSA